MPVTVIVEDGTIVADANAYADRTFGDAYLERHLHSANDWDSASDFDQDSAIVWAAELMDIHLIYPGRLAAPNLQTMGWPRTGAKDRDGELIQSNVIPIQVKRANVEFARHLIIRDRTLEHPTRGYKFLTAGSAQISIDSEDRTVTVPDSVLHMLGPLATMRTSKPGGGLRVVELVRA